MESRWGSTDIHQLIFTAGMTLVDSLDSILMLYSYTNFAERSFVIFERPRTSSSPSTAGAHRKSEERAGITDAGQTPSPAANVRVGEQAMLPSLEKLPSADDPTKICSGVNDKPADEPADKDGALSINENTESRHKLLVKQSAMSGLSLLLTLISILLAFRYRRAFIYSEGRLTRDRPQHLAHHDHGPHRGAVPQVHGSS